MKNIDSEILLKFLKKMLQIRYFEDQVDDFYVKGLIRGTGHLYTGMEAVAVGSILALKEDDQITSTHRGHGHCIAKGADLKLMMAELLGRATGYCKGKGGSMHIADINIGILGANGIVGGGIPIAAGATLAIKMMTSDQVVLCFMGDGATNQGVFHESANMASIWNLPVIFVIENNKYGMSSAIDKVVNIDKLSIRAKSYGIEGFTINGNDVMGVFNTSIELISRAREGKGPFFLECETYRWKGHSKMDAEKYRTKEEVESWKIKCPIERHKKYLLKNKIATSSKLKAIDREVREEIIEANNFALNSPLPEPKDAVIDVYSQEGREA